MRLRIPHDAVEKWLRQGPRNTISLGALDAVIGYVLNEVHVDNVRLVIVVVYDV